MQHDARITLAEHAAELLDEFARGPAAADDSARQAMADEATLVANGLRNLAAELRGESGLLS